MKSYVGIIAVIILACVLGVYGKRFEAKLGHPNMPSNEFIREQVRKNRQRISGGAEATIAQAPFQVFIFTQSPDDVAAGKGEICGGAFISADFILTAAHCLGTEFSELTISVYYGANEPSDRNSGNRAQGSRFYIHDKFSPNTGFENDIALIQLSAPVAEEPGVIEYVNLATEVPDVGSRLQIQGYGQTFEGQEFDANTVIKMMIGQITVASDQACTNYFNSITIPPDGASLPAGFFKSTTTICISNVTGVATCHGDSGGSAVFKNPGDRRWTSVGLVSYGGNTCPGAYAGFTRVPHYISWVQQILGGVASTSSPSGSPSSTESPSSSPSTGEPTFTSSPSGEPSTDTPSSDSPTTDIVLPTESAVPDTILPTLAPGSTTTFASGPTSRPTTRVPTTTLRGATTSRPTSSTGPIRVTGGANLVAFNALLIVAALCICL